MPSDDIFEGRKPQISYAQSRGETPAKLSYEEWLIALCMWREARGNGHDGMLAVNWVIRNRVRMAATKTTAYSVITRPSQFSSFNAKDANASQFPNPSNPEWVQACGIVTQPGPDPYWRCSVLLSQRLEAVAEVV
jgi:spore germination cell wall hydrolase CwlJ-like protein